MQEQLKQARNDMKTRRLHRQRSMPTHLFRPPSPPAPEPAKPEPATNQKPPVSIFDTDAIDFIDSDEEDGGGGGDATNAVKTTEKPTEKPNPAAAENSTITTENPPQIVKEPTPEETTTVIETTTVLEGGLIVPMVVESRGYVTTDEGESDSESEADGPATIEDSGVCNVDTDDYEGISPMQEDGEAVENSIAKMKNSMEISTAENFTTKVNSSQVVEDEDDEYLDEDEMGEGFDETID